ncbi:hypothetical protein GCM10009856_25620 [Mycolicibacterium llatzerense]
MRTGVDVMVGRGHDVLILARAQQTGDRAGHGAAAGHREGTALAEVVLHVDDDQRPHVSTVDRLLRNVRCRSVRTRV